MTTLPESPEVRSPGSAGANDFMRRLAGLGPGALRLLRPALQERRGTAAEQAGDAERARVLDREINRRRTALNPPRDFRPFADPSAPFPA